MFNIKSKLIAKQFKKPFGLLGRFFSKFMEKGNTILYDTIIDDIPENSCRLLEIGFGPGVGLFKILDKYKNLQVEGVDFSKLMVKKAKKRNKKYIKEGRLTLQFKDIRKNNIEKNIYDRIIALNVIYFWENLNLVFKNIFNGLKNNGIFILCMMKKSDLIKVKFTQTEVFEKYELNNIMDELKAVGFKNVSYDTYSSKSYASDSNESFFIYAQK